MSSISLLPKRALAYPGTRLTFVDESSVGYCFGSAVRITHLLPDKVTCADLSIFFADIDGLDI